MKRSNLLFCMLGFLLTGLLTACGGSGGGDGIASDGSTAVTPGSATAIRTGVAVDPYIVGAVFEEIGADGLQRQSASTPSDSLGRFRFTNALQEGSTIRIKSSSRGMHGNAPFQGILKRRVQPGDSGSLIVTPLTTLVANGMTENEVVSMLAAAGLSGLSPAYISADPMQRLAGATTGITNASINLLKANMAVNTMLLALQDYNYAGQTQSPVSLADCVALSNKILNPEDFNSLSNSISGFDFDDLAAAAVNVQNTVVAQLRQELAAGGSVSSSRFNQLSSGAVANLSTIATEIATARIGNGGTGGSGGGQIVDAAAIFNGTCSDCHSLGTRTSIMDLNGDGSLVNGKFGNGATHNGLALTAAEITAMADYFNGTTPPVTPPPTPVTGSELYTQECQGCHGSLATNSISNRTAAGITAAINGNAGGMGSLTLTPEQITLIANALPIENPPPATSAPDRTGAEVYDQDCAVCHMLGSHDATGNGIDLASNGVLVITKIQSGHRSTPPNTNELAALADYVDTFVVAPPPATTRTPETIYNDICGVCHFLTGYDTAGNIDLAGMGSTAVTKVAGGHGGSLSTEELTGLATWLDTFSPPPPPAVARTGQEVYDQNCAVCHQLYGYDAVGNGIDLASMGSTALTKLTTGHGGTVSAEEQQNVAAWLNTWTPAPPTVDRNGETVYKENCATCHKLNGYDTVGNIDLASQGNLVVTKLNSGHGGSVSSGEIINIADWVDTFTPPTPPIVARDGQTVYDDECLGCHKVNGYDANGTAPDIAGNGSGATTKINGGHNGVNILAEELSNLAAWLDTFQPGDPYTGSCNACHGQPPTIGAHEVHTSLADIGTNCNVCHNTAAHNGSIDLAFPNIWNAKSGSASSNGSTCSNIKCHGGGTTPNWFTGSLNTNTQCSSCHSRGTTQYNSYNSGEHRKHVVDKGYSCDTCHDPAKLANGHFGNLSTVSFEQNPSTTIKSSLSYSGGRCSTPRCHGGERW